MGPISDNRGAKSRVLTADSKKHHPNQTKTKQYRAFFAVQRLKITLTPSALVQFG